MQKVILHGSTTNTRAYILAVLLCIFLGLGEYVGWTRGATAAAEKLLNPVQSFEAEAYRIIKWPVESLFTGYRSAEQLREMQMNYAAQSAQLHELAKLRRENQALRELLENSDRTLEDRRIATPVVSLAQPAVASGRQEGVTNGMMVTFQDVLIGVVTEASEHQSRVALLTRKDSVPVLAKTDSGVQGIVIGDGKRVLLTEVPHDVDLNTGDKVVTVGQEGIRRDVLVGTIRSIDTKPSAPTQTAVIEQLVSFYDAPVVEVW